MKTCKMEPVVGWRLCSGSHLVGRGNTDGKHPCLVNGQTVLKRTPTQVEVVECWNETIIRNGLPPSISAEKNLKLPQTTWISTFLESVTNKITGLPLFSDLVWFTYKVSGM